MACVFSNSSLSIREICSSNVDIDSNDLRKFTLKFVECNKDKSQMQEVITSPVGLSDSAAKEFHRLMSDNEVGAGKSLRVGVKGGGCSGLTYILDFDEQNELDEEYIIKGVKVVIDPRHGLYLHGMEVDFENGLNDRGFIFNNPNAASTCGCGTSFAT